MTGLIIIAFIISRDIDMAYRPTFLENPDYLRDLSRLTARKIVDKWGISQAAVYNHLSMKKADIEKRIEELERVDKLEDLIRRQKAHITEIDVDRARLRGEVEALYRELEARGDQ